MIQSKRNFLYVSLFLSGASQLACSLLEMPREISLRSSDAAMIDHGQPGIGKKQSCLRQKFRKVKAANQYQLSVLEKKETGIREIIQDLKNEFGLDEFETDIIEELEDFHKTLKEPMQDRLFELHGGSRMRINPRTTEVGPTAELSGGPLDDIKDALSEPLVLRWKTLETKFDALQTENLSKYRFCNRHFKLGYSKVLFLLGDLIQNCNMGPPQFLQHIQILKSKALEEAALAHVDPLMNHPWLLHDWWGQGSLQVFVGEFSYIDSMVNGLHRSIPEISLQEKTDSLYLCLRHMMESLKNPNVSKGLEGETEAFTRIREQFVAPRFLGDINRIHSRLSIGKEDELKKIKSQEVFLTGAIQSILEYFYIPQEHISGNRQTVQLLINYHTVNFLHNSYPKILVEFMPENVDKLIFKSQLQFMEILDKLIQAANQGDSLQDKRRHLENILHFYDTNVNIQGWIDKFIENVSRHDIEFFRFLLSTFNP
ncbi:hypothetical protein PGT21_008334 [Puccinia graminis f. sp. tritici]|uniref:Uncharacterized protein n=1 Tax=Puccinia graminis f. sp. tritici TaxID=56615 RepID=A0A5B0NN52_PUCGR|nr:hypothetical protein PGT21_008334 [Puccinia graminis f. sp. tritici]KAA1090082.1 hypothetical protein PGTUg99_035287 [Puccinia graminis f. sp. tritici]